MAVHRRHWRWPCDIVRHEKRFFRSRRPFEPYGLEEVSLLLARRIARQTKGFPFYERLSSNRRYSEYDETVYEEATDGYGKIKITTRTQCR